MQFGWKISRPLAVKQRCKRPTSIAQPVSRVLSDGFVRTVIPLGERSLAPSSGLPAASLSGRTTPRRLFSLAPTGVCQATCVATRAVSSYLAVSPLPDPACKPAIGGLLSVALSVAFQRPDVIWRSVLWSPDFPRHPVRCRDRPAARSAQAEI